MTWQELGAPLDGLAVSHRRHAGDIPLLMVHGIGPGTTGEVNFAPLLHRLAPRFAAHLVDLAGFGASARRPRPPFFDVPFWMRQISAAIDRIVALHGRPPLLIGNSVGGALALKLAARRADLRQLLVIGAPARAHASAALRAFWRAPRNPAELAAALRPMTARQSDAPAALLAERFAAFADRDHAAYFDAMLADPDACLARAILTPPEAAGIRAHVTLMHGREDRACPAEATLSELLPLLPSCDLTLLGDCGHNVLSERCADVLAAIERLEKVELS